MSDPIGRVFFDWLGQNPNFFGDAVRATYTTGGTIAPEERMCLVNSPSPITLTLPPGTRDGCPIIIKNIGSAQVTLNATIDGLTVAYNLLEVSSAFGGVLRLTWSAALSSWLQV